MDYPKGALFDLDGTLLDTEPIYYEAYGEASAKFGKPYSNEIHTHIIGKGDAFGIKYVTDTLGIDPAAYTVVRDEAIERLMTSARPFPGALDVIQQFKDAGIPVAIATSSQASHVEIKRANNPELFALVEAVVCGDDPRVKAGKPCPDIFFAAADEIGVDPTQCWAFEDTPAGVSAVKAAGAKCFAMPDPRLPLEHYSAADVILDAIGLFKLSHPYFV